MIYMGTLIGLLRCSIDIRTVLEHVHVFVNMCIKKDDKFQYENALYARVNKQWSTCLFKIIHNMYHTIRIIVCVTMYFTYSFCLHIAVPDRNNVISLVILHFDTNRLNNLIFTT